MPTSAPNALSSSMASRAPFRFGTSQVRHAVRTGRRIGNDARVYSATLAFDDTKIGPWDLVTGALFNAADMRQRRALAGQFGNKIFQVRFRTTDIDQYAITII